MKSKNVEFIQLFDPDVMGDGPAANGYKKAGVPYRFAALKYGTKRADVGYAINNVDASNLWAAIGTAQYTSDGEVNGSLYYFRTKNPPGPLTAAVEFQFLRDGTTVRIDEYGTRTGRWAPAGATSGDAFDIRFTQSRPGGNPGTGSVLSTWLQVNATRNRRHSATVPGNTGNALSQAAYLIEIRRRSDGVTVVTSSVEMMAGVDILA